MNGRMGDELSRLLAERRGPPAPIDADRMRRERHARLQAEMERQGVEVAVLLHGPNVAYATGQAVRGVDVSHATFDRPVAVVVAGEERPHLLADDIDPALDVERHQAAWPELDEGAAGLGKVLADVAGPLGGRRLAVDEQSGAMLRAGALDGAAVVDASPLRHGKLMPGTHTPIVSPDEFRRHQPDYVFVSAWNYLDSIRANEPDYSGYWIVPLPEMRVY